MVLLPTGMMGLLWTSLTGDDNAPPARRAASTVLPYDQAIKTHRITSGMTFFVHLNVRLFVKKALNLTMYLTAKTFNLTSWEKDVIL